MKYLNIGIIFSRKANRFKSPGNNPIRYDGYASTFNSNEEHNRAAYFTLSSKGV